MLYMPPDFYNIFVHCDNNKIFISVLDKFKYVCYNAVCKNLI